MDLHPLIQAAMTADPFWDIIYKGALALILGLQGWLIHSMRNVQDMLNKWSVVLFGINGDNGLNSDVTALKKFQQEMIEQGIHPRRRRDD